jgi:hypothetical protein
MAFRESTFKIQGVCPLLCHNGHLADPMNQFSKAIKVISGKRKKTDADFEEMARLEWYGGLYIKDGKPAITGPMIKAMLVGAARKSKLGKQFTAGLFITGLFQLGYDGPGDIDALWADDRFRLGALVKVGTSRVMRTRPKFDNWSLSFTVLRDDTQVSEEDLNSALVLAGQIIGLGDWRPEHGRFTIVE